LIPDIETEVVEGRWDVRNIPFEVWADMAGYDLSLDYDIFENFV
jgi:hypothetical protein